MKKEGKSNEKEKGKEACPAHNSLQRDPSQRDMCGDNDLLVGMKAICAFTGYSESTIEKFRQEYDKFPIMNNGRLIMSKMKWNKFWEEVFEAENEDLRI